MPAASAGQRIQLPPEVLVGTGVGAFIGTFVGACVGFGLAVAVALGFAVAVAVGGTGVALGRIAVAVAVGGAGVGLALGRAVGGATRGADLGPAQNNVKDFELKAQPHTTGKGFQNKVVLSCLDTAEDFRVTRQGTGTLKLAGTAVDPLDTIPVVEVGGVSYGEGASCWTIPFWEELDDGHDYRPYIYGQKYDDFRLFNKARRFAR